MVHIVLKMIDGALINEFIFGTVHGFSNWYFIISNRIAKVTVKMASETTQINKGNNDDNEHQYTTIINHSRSSKAAGTKCSRKSLKKQRHKRVWDLAYNTESCARNIQTNNSNRHSMIVLALHYN